MTIFVLLTFDGVHADQVIGSLRYGIFLRVFSSISLSKLKTRRDIPYLLAAMYDFVY